MLDLTRLGLIPLVPPPGIATFFYETDETVKGQKREIAEKKVTFFLTRMNEQVKQNNGYFVNGKLSWADMTFVALLEYLDFMMGEEIVEKYEYLQQLKQTVLDLPAIKNWIEKRPASEWSS